MNFKARLLSGDIYRKRPDMNIEPGIFLDNLPDYSMIIGGKSKKSNTKINLMNACFDALKQLSEMKVDEDYSKKYGIIKGKIE